MKTNDKTQRTLKKRRIVTMTLFLLCFTLSVFAQDVDSVETLFKKSIKVSELWTPEIKVNSIQGDAGTLVGFYGGALLNRTVLLGISGAVNLTHPRVNYGYFGVIGQYIYNPADLVHLSGQILLASGTTKDYEDPKSGVFDNFWNISGAGFYLVEPGVNLEINLSKRITFTLGCSYRYVTGLDGNNKNVEITHVTNEDLSGMNINFGLKFAKEKKAKRQK
jgi:hypothetical protein